MYHKVQKVILLLCIFSDFCAGLFFGFYEELKSRIFVFVVKLLVPITVAWIRTEKCGSHHCSSLSSFNFQTGRISNLVRMNAIRDIRAIWYFVSIHLKIDRFILGFWRSNLVCSSIKYQFLS